MEPRELSQNHCGNVGWVFGRGCEKCVMVNVTFTRIGWLDGWEPKTVASARTVGTEQQNRAKNGTAELVV